jgi:hypothetical protein
VPLENISYILRLLKLPGLLMGYGCTIFYTPLKNQVIEKMRTCTREEQGFTG